MALVIAVCTGVAPAIGQLSFGSFTKAMVEKGSQISTCPVPPSNHTSPFMAAVENFAVIQTSCGVAVFVLGFIFVSTFNSIAENQVYRRKNLNEENFLTKFCCSIDI
jgi:hypothetical protein